MGFQVYKRKPFTDKEEKTMKRGTLWIILTCLVVGVVALSPWGAATEASAKEMVKNPSTGQMVEKPRYGGTLNAVMYDDPTVFDVYRHDPVGLQVIQFYLEKPLTVDWAIDRKITKFASSFYPESTLVPTCESWDVSDPLTLTLKVRKGIKWQNKPPVNGREFVANDIVFAYHRMCGLGSGFTEPTPYSFYDELKKIKSVEAPDKYTVVFKFKEAHPTFPLILMEAMISFLGFGIPPPTPSWGGMLSGAGREYMLEGPWIVFWPGLCLSLVVYGTNMFGDAVRDLLDPRLRGGLGRYDKATKRRETRRIQDG
jgi:ABC-type transport system substrate-binding protein